MKAVQTFVAVSLWIVCLSDTVRDDFEKAREWWRRRKSCDCDAEMDIEAIEEDVDGLGDRSMKVMVLGVFERLRKPEGVLFSIAPTSLLESM